MDWSRAKNILIIAFILTNIFLGYNIQRGLFRQEEIQLVSNSYINDVERLLKSYDVSLDVDIPKEVVSLPILFVKYKTFDTGETAKNFLGDNYIREVENVINKDFKREIFRAENKTLIIEGDKRLEYRDLSTNSNNYTLNEDTVVKLSEDFLKKHKLLRNDLSLSQIYYGREKSFDNETVYKLVYNQKYRNKFLGESYIHVYVNHRGVVGMEAMLLEYEKTQRHGRKVIPATEALMRALNTILEENQGPIEIKDIEVGYYFSPTDYMESDWKEIESGTAFPSWKITIQNGNTYFVEAYKN